MAEEKTQDVRLPDGTRIRNVPLGIRKHELMARLGIDSGGFVDRGTILPLGREPSGDVVPAWPQLAVDMAESAMLPGRILRGEGMAYGQTDDPLAPNQGYLFNSVWPEQPITTDDATQFALDYGIPSTIRLRPRPPSARELIDNAPTSEELLGAGSALFEHAKNRGLQIDPERYLDFVGDLEPQLAGEGIDKMLHPTASRVYDLITERVGQAPSIQDLQIIRRQIGRASNSVAPELADERRIAEIMRDRIDEFIDGLTDDDLVAGVADGAAEDLRNARGLWSRGRRSEIIDDIIERARDQASGFENGLRIGFRGLLRNKKLIRGFSREEVAAIREVVHGGPVRKALRVLGKLSFDKSGGSSFLGGSIGMGAGGYIGSTVGGPIGGGIGAVAVPVAGLLAQRGAEASTRRAADLARAIAATGGRRPDGGAGVIVDQILRALPPTMAAELMAAAEKPGGLLGGGQVGPSTTGLLPPRGR